MFHLAASSQTFQCRFLRSIAFYHMTWIFSQAIVTEIQPKHYKLASLNRSAASTAAADDADVSQ